MANFTQRIPTNNDDAEEFDSDKGGGNEGDMDLSSSDLEMNPISDSSGSGFIGMRWTNVTIPKGATIDSAKIQFHVDEVLDNAALTVTMRGEAADSAIAFSTTAFDITNRTQTTAFVDWVIPSWLALDDEGSAQLSAELKTIVQEIIDRSGWSSGNDLVLMKLGWTGTGTRTAESRNGEVAAAPELSIDYTEFSFEQEGYRWRNDDGSESAATFRQSQDVVDTVDKETNIRLRTLLDSTGDPGTFTRTLQYKRDDEADSEWRDV